MIRWDEEKSALLKLERGLSFEEAVQGEYLALLRHPKRSGQWLYLVKVAGYVWVAPCVYDGTDWFLKTLFPSRKYTKKLQRGELP